MGTGESAKMASYPKSGIAGLILVTVCWSLNWGLDGLRTHLFFFPLWVGYCLSVDGLTRWRNGSSLLSRNLAAYLLLFILSIPVWWLFEGLNRFTRNWSYLGRDSFSDLEYFLLSSLCFSTVIPAVFSTAEFLGTCQWVKSIRRIQFPVLSKAQLWMLHVSGWIMLFLMLVFPKLFFPFLWLSCFFILDPLNALRGRPSLIADLGQGQIRRLVTYGLGALVCGFFWELWNLYSFPKWIYSIPYLDACHIFEMPLAGYGGYIPFGWELYAIYHLFRAFRL